MRWKSPSTADGIVAEDVGLDLVSSQKQAAGCILAVTVGPKGLLKPMATDAPPESEKP